jgi:hypothetical protein
LRPPTAESRWPSPQLSEMPAGFLLSWSSALRREVNPATSRFVPQRDVASSRLGGRLARRRGVPEAPSELSCSIASVLSGTPADCFYSQHIGRVGHKQVSRTASSPNQRGKFSVSRMAGMRSWIVATRSLAERL